MMLLGCLVANLCAIAVVSYLLMETFQRGENEIWKTMQQFGWFFDPLAVFLMIGATFLYEKPIRIFLNLQKKKQSISQKIAFLARKRVLNTFFTILSTRTVDNV